MPRAASGHDEREHEERGRVPDDAPRGMRGARPDGRWRGSGAVALLWFGVLAAPAAFLLDLTANFALVERVCARGGAGALWAISVGAVLLALAGLVQSWRSWRAVGPDPEPRGEGVEESSPRSTGHTLASELRTDAPGPVGRSRFMGLAGIAVSGFFLLVLLASLIPPVVLAPCD